MFHFKNDIITVRGLYYRGITNDSPIIKHIKTGAPVTLILEPDNEFDDNAVKVCISDFLYGYRFIGYIPRGLAARLSPILTRGSVYECEVFRVARLKSRPSISIRLKTYPVPAARTLPILSQPSSPRAVSINPQSPTGKNFRQHKDLNRWSKNFDEISGVYVIWNRDYHVYIGQSLNIGQRWRKHFNQLVTETHHNELLQTDWMHMGEKYFRFDILEELPPDRLDEMEAFYIRKFNSWRDGYNMTEDGRWEPPVSSTPFQQQTINIGPVLNNNQHANKYADYSPVPPVSLLPKAAKIIPRNINGTTKPPNTQVAQQYRFPLKSLRGLIEQIFNQSMDDLRENVKND